MHNQENNNEDLLRQYLRPEMIEKAPEGFTTEVMTHIQAEPIPSQFAISFLKTKRIPIISIGIALLLTLATILVPGTEGDTVVIPYMNLIKNFRLTLPELNLNYLFSLQIPAILLYILGAMLTLALFDRALNVFFHRER
jgi:hypothetical protein